MGIAEISIFDVRQRMAVMTTEKLVKGIDAIIGMDVVKAMGSVSVSPDGQCVQFGMQRCNVTMVPECPSHYRQGGRVH